MGEYIEAYKEKLALLDGDAKLTPEEQRGVIDELHEIDTELKEEIDDCTRTMGFNDNLAKGLWGRAKIGGIVAVGLGTLTVALTVLEQQNPTELYYAGLQDFSGFLTSVSGIFSGLMGTMTGVLKWMSKSEQDRINYLLKEKSDIAAVKSERFWNRLKGVSQSPEK